MPYYNALMVKMVANDNKLVGARLQPPPSPVIVSRANFLVLLFVLMLALFAGVPYVELSVACRSIA